LKEFDGSFAAHPKQARDVEIDLINQSQVLVAFGILDSSTPIASIWSSARCSSPKVTTCSTASKTLSQEVRKASAVSFHDSRRAQRAKKSMYALVSVRLPSPEGTSSTTTTPQRRQSTRRIVYRRKTGNPHSGMNSKRRWASWCSRAPANGSAS